MRMDCGQCVGRCVFFLLRHDTLTPFFLTPFFPQAILLHREIDRSQWSIQLSDSREAYTSVRQHFLKYINNPDELPSTVDPLAEDAEVCNILTLKRRCMYDSPF